MSKYKYEKEFIFFQRTPDQAKLFLKDKNNLDLTQVLDQKKNNCLHQCAFQGSLQLMKVYVDYQKQYFKRFIPSRTQSLQMREKDQQKAQKSQIKQRLKKWVNQPNNQGFTPVHYAAFKGFVHILKFMDDLEADYNIKTNSGLGILHLAAQGDQIKTFIFYRNRIPINNLDNRQSTPLHWAAFSGSEKVTEYLLAQRAQQNIRKNPSKKSKSHKKNPLLQQQQPIDWIDAQDIQKQTALHLATTNGNTKIVRRLLIAGANRHIKNKQHKQPLQIANQNQFSNIEQFLDDKYSWLDYIKFFMNIKIKYEPRNKSLVMPIIFLLLALLMVGTINLALDYDVNDKEEGHTSYKFVEWIQNGLFAFLIILYLSLILHSPKLKGSNYHDLLKQWLPKQQPQSKPLSIYQSQHTIISSSNKSNITNGDAKQVCFRCVQYKPSRSYHCDICNTCIPQYDHHCPWINNCVGKHNFLRFICFIVFLFLALTWIFVIGIHFVLFLVYDEVDTLGVFKFRDWVHDNYTVVYVYVVLSMLLFVVFAIPLILLIGVHLKNLYYGKTTYERFSRANQSFFVRSETIGLQFSEISGMDQNKKGCSCCKMFSKREDNINSIERESYVMQDSIRQVGFSPIAFQETIDMVTFKASFGPKALRQRPRNFN